MQLVPSPVDHLLAALDDGSRRLVVFHKGSSSPDQPSRVSAPVSLGCSQQAASVMLKRCKVMRKGQLATELLPSTKQIGLQFVILVHMHGRYAASLNTPSRRIARLSASPPILLPYLCRGEHAICPTLYISPKHLRSCPEWEIYGVLARNQISTLRGAGQVKVIVRFPHVS